jgi:hypothetical protein
MNNLQWTRLSGFCVTQFRVNDNAETHHEGEWNVEAQFREIYPRQSNQVCDLQPQPHFYAAPCREQKSAHNSSDIY